MTSSVDPDHTAPIGTVCSGSTLFALNLFASNVRQLFATGDFNRRHFQVHFFLGALKVKCAVVLSIMNKPSLKGPQRDKSSIWCSDKSRLNQSPLATETYLLSSTRLINSLKHEHSCKILYFFVYDPVFLQHGAIGRSVIFECGISSPYSFSD